DEFQTNNSEASACWVVRLRNAGTPDGTSASGSGTNVDPPSHSPSGGEGNYVLIVAVAWDGGNPVDVSGFPAGYGNRIRIPRTDAGDTVSLAGCLRKANVTTEDPGAFASTNETWSVCTVAVPYAAP